MKLLLLISLCAFLKVTKCSDIATDATGTSESNEPKFTFGSFGVEESSSESAGVAAVAVVAEPEKVVVKEPLNFIKVTINNGTEPDSSKPFEVLKSFEMAQRCRFHSLNETSAGLRVRLANDHPILNLSEYSMEIFQICSDVLEWPRNELALLERKKSFLKRLFEVRDPVASIGTTLYHPMCSDAFKYLADAFETEQLNWLVQNAPDVLFDNVEMLMNLSDYSFLTMEVFGVMKGSDFASAVDFLSNPNFVRTVPMQTLMIFLVSSFSPSRHWNILAEHRGIDNILNDETIINEARNYSFLCGIFGNEKLPEDYVANAAPIIAAIRAEGLGPLLLASLLAYIQESNDLIRSYMNQIAEAWAYGHRNDHLGLENIPEINAEFNETAGPLANNLLFIRDQRIKILELISDLEAEKVNTLLVIRKSLPDCAKSLRVLAEAPFDAMIRMTFVNRFSFLLQAPIHPEDERNAVKLPRLVSTDPNAGGFAVEANPMYVSNPYLWSALWRNIFFTDGELWRQDPELTTMDPAAFTAHWKAQYEVIYKDSSTAQPGDLIAAWMKLTKQLPGTFFMGNRFQRFISSIATPPFVVLPPPFPQFEIPREAVIIRKVFTKRVALALAEVPFLEPGIHERLAANFSDSEEVLKELERIRDLRLENGFMFKATLPYLDGICHNIAMCFMQNDSGRVSSRLLFKAVKTLENGFLTLGTQLTEDQIRKIGASSPISMILAIHGRALTRSQITGLLKNPIGRELLKFNDRMLRSLIDYSAFTFNDFTEFKLKIDEIRLNASTVPHSVSLLSLNQIGFSSIDNPINTVYGLGPAFWANIKTMKNFSAWELLNPIVLAMDSEFTQMAQLIYHITGLKAKLQEKTSLNVAIVLLTKWLIAQDWFALSYRVIKNMGAEFFENKLFIDRLDSIYRTYVTEGEALGRADAIAWIESNLADRPDCSEEAFGALASLGAAIRSPLTRFREATLKSKCPLARIHSACYSSGTSSIYSASQSQFIRSLIKKYFKPADRSVWVTRFDILNDINFIEESVDSQLVRTRLSTLPLSDALIYKWALEMEGVSVDIILNDKSNVKAPIYPSAKRFNGLMSISASEKTSTNQKKKSGNRKK